VIDMSAELVITQSQEDALELTLAELPPTIATMMQQSPLWPVLSIAEKLAWIEEIKAFGNNFEQRNIA
jgi:hypothetical protein